ncbi:MAG TPA: endonuclease [Phycisphaerales bacterium]|nr:endonuclease [Phycisphaerales bacterium]
MKKRKPPKKDESNRYHQIVRHIFFRHYAKGMTEFTFARSEIETAAASLGIPLPKNIGDSLYTYRFRMALPEEISRTAPPGKNWIIKLAGKGKYKFELVAGGHILPNEMLADIKIPDATPGVIDMYALNDEQALLGKLHYNRLIDIFLGFAAYRLQSHLRTTVPGMGQVETDEIYVGIDSRGVHYIVPVQAKGGTDKLSIVQVEQDLALCRNKFPSLFCIPVAAQFMRDDVIALFSFVDGEDGVGVSSERHYRLVAPESMTREEWEIYRKRLFAGADKS